MTSPRNNAMIDLMAIAAMIVILYEKILDPAK